MFGRDDYGEESVYVVLHFVQIVNPKRPSTRFSRKHSPLKAMMKWVPEMNAASAITREHKSPKRSDILVHVLTA